MIWVVTDHHVTRESLTSLIAARGYAVAELDCGDEVRRRVRFRQPALIILDCAFPDSFEMLKALRAGTDSGSVPVVMFSIDDQNLKDRALLAGANAYVPKGSMDWAELLVEVARYAGEPPGPP